MLDVLAGSLVFYQLPRHIGETHHLVKLSYRKQTRVCRYLRPPEFEHQMTVEKQSHTPVFRCTQWILAHEVKDRQQLAF